MFATATAPTTGANCSDVPDDCGEPMSTFASGLAAGSVATAADPVLVSGAAVGAHNLWNVVANNGVKHR